MRRTMLFIPGNNPSMIINSDVFGADSIIYDLEDAVSPNEKDAARILVRNILRNMKNNHTEKVVRINSLKTEFWKKDLEEILPIGIDVILIPKAETQEEMILVEQYLEKLEEENNIEVGKTLIIPLIESAMGIENSFQIAKSSKRITALFLGAEDLTADINAKRTKKGEEIFYSRTRIVVAAKAAGIEAIDTPFTDANDYEGLREDTMFAKELGFTGKAVISPRHIDIINEVFTPSEEELYYAERVIDTIEQAEKEGKGVVALDGKMIDAPIVNRARQVIDMWNKTNGGK